MVCHWQIYVYICFGKTETLIDTTKVSILLLNLCLAIKNSVRKLKRNDNNIATINNENNKAVTLQIMYEFKIEMLLMLVVTKLYWHLLSKCMRKSTMHCP